MFGLGATELIVILVIALLVFGPRKLPEIGGALGKGIRDFRKSLEGKETTTDSTISDQRSDAKSDTTST